MHAIEFRKNTLSFLLKTLIKHSEQGLIDGSVCSLLIAIYSYAWTRLDINFSRSAKGHGLFSFNDEHAR